MRFRTRRSEEHTSELQSRFDLVCRLLLEKKNKEDGLVAEFEKKGRATVAVVKSQNTPQDQKPRSCLSPVPATRVSLLMTLFFFFNDPAPTELYTLSLHDALPISGRILSGHPCLGSWITYGLGSENENLPGDRKSTRLNSSHVSISYAVFCLK